MEEIAMTEHAPDLDVMHARQARRGRHALMILIWSLALGLIALAIVWAFYSGSLAALHRAGQTPPPQMIRSVSTGPGTASQAAAPSWRLSGPGSS
jgi:hypothetical protein